MDEAFGLAVGLRTIGAGELVPDALCVARTREGLGAEGRAVVRQESADLYALAVVSRNSDGTLCGHP